MKLMVIWGSSRTGRKSTPLANWVKQAVADDGRFDLDFVDLKDLDLPFFDEPISPFMMKSLDDYSHPEGKTWAERVSAAKCFILITPEYNRGYSAVLKNALDWAGPSFVDKPVGFIGYGGIAGGAYAIGQLRQVTVELGLIQVGNAIHFPNFQKSFDEAGLPTVPNAKENLTKMFDEIIRLHQIFTKQKVN